jgi:hypothetical protein
MAYGIRRRSFRGRAGSAARWLSIHLYMGLCVVLVATLHCGFHFGANVHTLAYVLLWAVVLSGLWGVYAYLRFPALLVRERGGASRERLLAWLDELDERAMGVARGTPPDIRDLVADAIQRTRLGGSTWAQLSGRDTSLLLAAPAESRGYARLISNSDQRALIERLARYQASSEGNAVQGELHELLLISGEKADVLRRARREVQLQDLLRIWLYVHVPLSFGLLAAVFAHVVAVFFYW